MIERSSSYFKEDHFGYLKFRWEYNIEIYREIQKDGPNFVRLYFLNYTSHVDDVFKI
jgi:hypothetical protein